MMQQKVASNYQMSKIDSDYDDGDERYPTSVYEWQEFPKKLCNSENEDGSLRERLSVGSGSVKLTFSFSAE